MNYHSISNKTSGYIGFISSLCCWIHLPYELSGTSLTLLVFPFEGSQVCWCNSCIPCDLLKHLHLAVPQRRHNWMGGKTKSLTSLCSIQKKNCCFLLSKKVNATLQCSRLSTFFTTNEAEKSDQFKKENTLVRGYKCVSIITCFSICCLLWVAHKNLGYGERL